jgi:hypothetical protein
MKDPWALPDDLLMTDKILFKLRQTNVLDPMYSHIKSIVESVCGPSEYTETRIPGLRALGQPVKKSPGRIQ